MSLDSAQICSDSSTAENARRSSVRSEESFAYPGLSWHPLRLIQQLNSEEP